MRSPMLVGVGLAIAAVLLGTFVYVLSLQSQPNDAKSANVAIAPSKQLTPSAVNPSPSVVGSAGNPMMGSSASSLGGSVNNRSSTSEAMAARAAEGQKRQDRRLAMQELSRLLSQADKSKPEEVRAAFKKLEATLPDDQSKQQMILASRTYEYGFRLQALTQELATLKPSAKNADKDRQQAILAEITEIQSKIQAAAASTRQYAENRLKEQR